MFPVSASASTYNFFLFTYLFACMQFVTQWFIFSRHNNIYFPYLLQPRSRSATFCQWGWCLKERSSAVWRRRLETAASWPGHRGTTPQWSRTTPTRREPASSCRRAARRPCRRPTGPWSVSSYRSAAVC